ncbi:MAG: hypothetical protein GY845_29555 [Planctomycetes bacterium]|nr:hypothetical protein [Planctomycetota bacterium]
MAEENAIDVTYIDVTDEKAAAEIKDKFNMTIDEYVSRQIKRNYQQSELLLSSYAMASAAKLIQLTDCEKEETARKACIDILTMPPASMRDTKGTGNGKEAEGKPMGFIQSNPEVASKLLDILAEHAENRSGSRQQYV